MREVSKSLETGLILGGLIVGLAATGLAISPTVGQVQSNGLYVAHLALGALLVLYTIWHLIPIRKTLFRRADSMGLMALVLVETWTGIELWQHWYLPLPKSLAVLTHLAITGVLLLPLVTHGYRGFRVWRASRKVAGPALARRVFLRLGAYTAMGIGLAAAFGRAAVVELEEWRLNSIGRVPSLEKSGYRLRVTGLVNKPITLSWDDLMKMRQVTSRFTHHCVEGWTYTDTFTGIPLPDIIEAAGGMKAGARMLILKSPETSTHPFTYGRQYTTNFPAEDVREDMLLVHKAHGEDLPRDHGFPLRMMTPSKWGYKACKWLTEIEVSADPEYRGYWERAGYHNDGDYPGPIWG